MNKQEMMKKGGVLLLAFCALTFFILTVISPPSLMDDVDSVTAQIARHMIDSGDWMTARLNGIAYFEKPALRYWIVAIPYLIFGVSDWVARIPIALAAVILCLITRQMGRWAFRREKNSLKDPGTLAGIVLMTCVGIFLFTRVLIPDVVLTLTTTLAMWGLIRALDPDEVQPRRWSILSAVNLGLGFLLKGVVAFVFPVGAGFFYLLITKQLWPRSAWRRIGPISGALVILVIISPWLIWEIIHHPPYFDFAMKSEPGKYHGFFWFFFLNEHLFRYLNLRYPRDYNTVPRAAFWLYHLLWLFPWSVYFPFIASSNFRPTDRAGRMRLLCLCWIGFTLLFFTFSTTQEYYSMPCYPAFALLLGSALSEEHPRFKWSTRAASAVAFLAALGCGIILWQVRNITTTGDIANALSFSVSTLSLGKIEDLTLTSFAYLRWPLAIALCAFLVGSLGSVVKKSRFAVTALSAMMLLFFLATHQAMVILNPYFGSRPLAEALLASPPGQLIVDDQYYAFSSVFFYTNREALLLNGRVVNLEYGSYEPGAPNVFIADQDLPGLWNLPERKYLTTSMASLPRFKALLGERNLFIVEQSGGKILLTNQELDLSRVGADDEVQRSARR